MVHYKEVHKPLVNKKNILSILIVVMLLLAVPLGLKLIKEQQTLRSKAGAAPIAFQGPNVSLLGDRQVFKLDDQGTPTVGLTLTSPFGPGDGSSGVPLPVFSPSVIPSIPTSLPPLPNNSIPGCTAIQRNVPTGYAISLVTNDLAIQASDFYLMLSGTKFSGKDAGVKLESSRSDATSGIPSINFTVTWPNTSARLAGVINDHGATWGWDYVVTPITGDPNARGVGYGSSNVSASICQAFSNTGSLVIPVPGADPNYLGIHFTNLRMQPFF